MTQRAASHEQQESGRNKATSISLLYFRYRCTFICWCWCSHYVNSIVRVQLVRLRQTLIFQFPTTLVSFTGTRRNGLGMRLEPHRLSVYWLLTRNWKLQWWGSHYYWHLNSPAAGRLRLHQDNQMSHHTQSPTLHWYRSPVDQMNMWVLKLTLLQASDHRFW